MSMTAEFIKKWEGFSNNAYADIGGKPTIGYGTTIYEDGKPVKLGDFISRKGAEALLELRINQIVTDLERHLGAEIMKNKGVKTALVSLVYNIGLRQLVISKCFRAIKERKWDVVFKEWDWFYVKKTFSLGLAKRRAAELDMLFSQLTSNI